jgi:hypothetical protein
MARYQVLFWRHIPLGVKAIDVNGMVRKNLPARFQEAFQTAVVETKKSDENPYTTSGFRWTEEQNREGTAADVAVAIAAEVAEAWNEAEALAQFEARNTGNTFQFVDLNNLHKI